MSTSARLARSSSILTAGTLGVALTLTAAAVAVAQVPDAPPQPAAPGAPPPAAAPAATPPAATAPATPAPAAPGAVLYDLGEAHDLVLSPDGKHVYVVGFLNGTILAFTRDPANGTLTHRQTLRQGVGGVGGMGGATAVVISSDGRYLYVASVDAGTVAVFTRDPATGDLTFLEKHLREDVPSLDGATSITLSSDEKQVYVGGLGNGTVTVFGRDPATGKLTFASSVVDGTANVDGLAGARDVEVSRDGKHVYVAGLAESAVVAFRRDANTGALGFVEFEQSGKGGVEGLVGAWGLALSPDGKHLYVASQFDDSLTVFARDPSTGALTYVETRKQEEDEVSGMDGAVTVLVSGDGKHVYLTGSSEGAIAVFARDPDTGKLTFVESVKDGEGDVRGLGGVFNLALTADGRELYAISFDDGAVVHFMRDPATGKLTFADAVMRSGDDAPL